ncbi:MAG: type 2 lanthipeptide synthetase LanM family protein [Desulfotomaculaceae bacterium]|nr:type 2 lanthipeptide synthetase LanM family protein [Desulfotomaculaceae bacterium]
MNLSPEVMYRLAGQGAFLKERLEGNTIPAGDKNTAQQVEKEWEMWKSKAGGNGGEQAFQKRLGVEDISLEEAKAVLGEVTWRPDRLLPEWVNGLANLLSLFPVAGEQIDKELYFNPENDIIPQNDIVAWILPLAYHGERQLQEKLGGRKELFAPSAISNLSRTLIKRLSHLSFRTLNYHFRLFQNMQNPVALLGVGLTREQAEKAYADFAEELRAGKWADILLEYPVLARQVAGELANWINNMGAMAEHLARDWDRLKGQFWAGREPGKVTGIEADASDAHNHGKSVCILTFSSGVKIVYKPRGLAVDKAWAGFARWLRQRGCQWPPKVPETLDCGSYGWTEYAAYQAMDREEEAADFYRRAGVLLALIYVLGGNDFHGENLIACREHPVPVDMETLLLPRVRPFQTANTALWQAEAAGALDILNDSVVRTGFLPMWKRKNQKGDTVEWGALTSVQGDFKNLPLLNGARLYVQDYRAELLEGFREAYGLLLKYQEELLGEASPLELFRGCKFRFLIRSTQVYADMLQYVSQPRFLKSGLIYSLEIERLAPAYLLYAPEERLRELWYIFLSERDALERGDIPIFYGEASGIALLDHEKELCDAYFLQSAMDRTGYLIGRLDQEDLAFQTDLIIASLAIYGGSSHSEKRATIRETMPPLKEIRQQAPGLFLKEAERIYEEIMGKRIRQPAGDATWIVKQYDVQTQKMNLGLIGFSLYDGFLGLYLFMAALYHRTKREEIRLEVIEMLQNFRMSLHDPDNPMPLYRFPLGLGSGVAGIIRAFAGLQYYLAEDFAEDVLLIIRRLLSSRARPDRQFDVLGGAAGLLLVLTNIYRTYRKDAILDLADICARTLLKGRTTWETGYRVWLSGIENAPLTGLGHGAGGIACALLSLYDLTGGQKLWEAAEEALAYENSVYDQEYRNWPDFRKNPDLPKGQKAFMAGWCSGAPGVGLTRLAMLQHEKDLGFLHRDIENALAFTLAFPVDYSDHICCGGSGRVDFLIEASRTLNRPDLMEEARKRMQWMRLRREKSRHYVLNGEDGGAIFNPSFFQGLSGIGYQMLRCLAPEDVFSVLI